MKIFPASYLKVYECDKDPIGKMLFPHQKMLGNTVKIPK